ncbi:DUF2065 domain-containing protein [Marinicella litoralis]|uniref:DUF2065 domain-containing protein n=1 Tax=Marinicella litoralis TaxID=644220 RepID=A0A4R6XUW0_9GAMM|nr:DUF2065 domain-containing protein [Marinicella litoralis]TDR23795.1 hypothetical protein C8D91_0661 [Marinicella litoralis]
MIEHPIIAAIALVMIFEGLLPFIAPKVWKNMLLQLAQMEDIHLRIFGATMMVAGAITFKYIQS